MFAKSVLFSSLVALAMGKPVARRNFDIPGSTINVVSTSSSIHPGSFDINSATVTGFNPEHFSFNNFGGLPSLGQFDNFFGQGNFCGVQNQHVLIQQQVCQVTEVTIVQQQLAIIAEYAKQVILTQSCEVESQTLIFSQWLGGLVNWGQDLRRINGIAPTFDSVIASQIVNVVQVDPISHVQVINTHDFGFGGSSIGSNAVTVIGQNWVNEFSPQTVGFVWESAVHAAGPHVPLGVQCSSQVCTSPVISSSGIAFHGSSSGIAFPGSSSGVIVSQKKA